jgi:hypothetical protein
MLGVAGFGSSARGQGITLQLPTYRTFRTVTTVSVPDRGGIDAGGVSRSRSSRQHFGTPLTHGGVAVGADRQASGLHVSASIHDHQEMDRQMLAPSADRIATDSSAAARGPAPLLPSVAQSRARQQAAAESRQFEAETCLKRGLDAVAAGKLGVAKIHLQMAARRASGSLKQRIAAELTRLDQPLAGKIDR